MRVAWMREALKRGAGVLSIVKPNKAMQRTKLRVAADRQSVRLL